jgi:hypothetical protein
VFCFAVVVLFSRLLLLLCWWISLLPVVKTGVPLEVVVGDGGAGDGGARVTALPMAGFVGCGAPTCFGGSVMQWRCFVSLF